MKKEFIYIFGNRNHSPMHHPFSPLAGIPSAASHAATGYVGDGPQIGEVNIFKKKGGGGDEKPEERGIGISGYVEFRRLRRQQQHGKQGHQDQMPKMRSDIYGR
jgi:hypothetical protein